MITVHEFGHYIIGKIFKFKINEFAIGMGPALYKKQKKNGELFSIRLLPLGGYCAFEGEDQSVNDPGAFNNKNPWQRILVLIAGATMNFIAAIIIFCISIGCYGQMCLQSFEVLPQPESVYSLQDKDVLLTINGKDLYLTTDLIGALNGKKKGDKVTATVLRNKVKTDIEIILREDATSKSMEDYENIFKSLGIATLSAVTKNITPTTSVQGLLANDIILRISKTEPVFENIADPTARIPSGKIICSTIKEDGTITDFYIDESVYLNEARAYKPEDFVALISEFSSGETVYIYVSRGDDRLVLPFELGNDFNEIKSTPEGIYTYFNVTVEQVGYRMYSENVPFGFFESIGRGFVYAFKNVTSSLSAFWQLITGKLSINAIGGPVTTITVTSQYASLGLNYLLEIAGFIGVSLAVFNLLPVPALDGARVVFVIIEWIRKKPVNRNIEGAIHTVGLIALLLFAVAIDLVKCF